MWDGHMNDNRVHVAMPQEGDAQRRAPPYLWAAIRADTVDVGRSRTGMRTHMRTLNPRGIAVATVLALTATVAALGSGVAATANDNDWARFRGPNGNGVSETSNLPVEVGPDTNVVWKTELPAGHSSPVLSERPYLPDRRRWRASCLTHGAGSRERRGAVAASRRRAHARRSLSDPRNNPAAPSPAVDGETRSSSSSPTSA